jgi:hypothetical protein
MTHQSRNRLHFARKTLFASAVQVFALKFVIGIFNAARSQAQTPTLSFEVASVKPSAPNGHASMGLFPGGRLVANYTTAFLLIETAYGVAPHELSHGPQWI